MPRTRMPLPMMSRSWLGTPRRRRMLNCDAFSNARADSWHVGAGARGCKAVRGWSCHMPDAVASRRRVLCDVT
eukprot:5447878-Prymnesium_polylepis.3